MENLRHFYFKALAFCQKQVDSNPYLAKSILIHISVVIILCILSFVSTLRFSSSANLEAQVNNRPKQMQVIQATSISSQDLNKQVRAYEHEIEKQKQARQDVKDAQQDIKEAREKAIKQAKAQAKAKAEAERKAKLKQQRKEELQKKKAAEEKQAKLEAEKKHKQEELQKKKAAEEKQAKIEAEKKRKQEELEKERKAREARIAKAKAQAQESARRQVQKNQAQSAISSYISKYQDRVGSNWIKDSCRGIYSFPRAIIRDGKFVKLTGTSGNYGCDQSLINAIKNTTPPNITNDIAKQTIQKENISFIFKQN